MAVNERLPEPLAPRPIAVLLLVQLYTVPATAPENVLVTKDPAHTVSFVTAFTGGIGLTVMVNVMGVPVQVTLPPV